MERGVSECLWFVSTEYADDDGFDDEDDSERPGWSSLLFVDNFGLLSMRMLLQRIVILVQKILHTTPATHVMPRLASLGSLQSSSDDDNWTQAT